MSESIIDFSAIVPGTSVRAVKIDGTYYMARRDVIMAVCKKNASDASTVWTRDMTDEDKMELQTHMRRYKFGGSGFGETEVLDAEGATLLIMMLPGKFAKSMRLKAAKLLSRFISADPMLTEELEVNRKRGREASCVAFVKEAFEEYNHAHKRKRTEMPVASYVYGTVSVAFPGLVKIGRTADIKDRLSSGNTFCAPSPHVVVALAPTFDAKRDENRAHDYFAASRQEGEFFKVSTTEVQEYFHKHISALYNCELAQFVDDIQYTKDNKDGEDLMTVCDMATMLTGASYRPEDVTSDEELAESKYKARYGADAVPGKQQVCFNGRAYVLSTYDKKDHDLL